MGGSVRTSTGRNVAGLRVSPSQVSLFSLGTPFEVSGRAESDIADRLVSCLAAEGFALTSRSPTPVSAAEPIVGPPRGAGILVADRDVTPDRLYNRLTAWTGGGLLLVWAGAVLLAVVFARDWWLQTVFLGAFFLAIPAWAIGSYRGLGFTSLVAVVGLEWRPEGGEGWKDSAPAPHLKITIGVGRVRSRRSMGRSLGRRWIVSVSRGPEVVGALDGISRRISSEGLESSSGLLPDRS